MIQTIKAATAIAGTLGFPSKMPGTSYGIPAANCKTGRKLALIPNSVCEVCYAFERGNYQYSSVKKAQAKRLRGIDHADWVAAMVFLLTKRHARPRKGKRLKKLHRWHDSGDLQSRDHLAKICAVARATPWLRHWLPTKEGKLVKDFKRDGGIIPGNLIIRLSAGMIDGAAPRALPHTSTVSSTHAAGGGHHCPARLQGNACGPCEACWDLTIPNIVYPIH